jgi:hypothetical protein
MKLAENLQLKKKKIEKEIIGWQTIRVEGFNQDRSGV